MPPGGSQTALVVSSLHYQFNNILSPVQMSASRPRGGCALHFWLRSNCILPRCVQVGLAYSNKVQLQPCDDRVEQHWAYHGPAVGNSGGGYMMFGDDTNFLSLVAQ